jgi:hypothetical protein
MIFMAARPRVEIFKTIGENACCTWGLHLELLIQMSG